MLPELQHCEEAEDFFEALHVPFDRKALDARRLVVMRRFGELLVEIVDRLPGAEDEGLRRMVRAALQEAYASGRGGTRARAAPVGSCAGCALAGGCGTQGPAIPTRGGDRAGDGGWRRAQATHFAECGVFDQIHGPGK